MFWPRDTLSSRQSQPSEWPRCQSHGNKSVYQKAFLVEQYLHLNRCARLFYTALREPNFEARQFLRSKLNLLQCAVGHDLYLACASGVFEPSIQGPGDDTLVLFFGIA